MPTMVTAKFQYGPLDMASLSKELVSMNVYFLYCIIIVHYENRAVKESVNYPAHMRKE